jgi:hypothetical protein
METLYTVGGYILSTIVSIGFIYAVAVLVERPLEFQLLGTNANRTFINAFFRRVWIYWLLPAVFSFTGVGLVLFPNAKVQDALSRVTTETLDKEGPYSKNVIEILGLQDGTMAVIGAIITAIVLVALVRIFIVTYNPNMASSTYFSFLGSLAIFALLLQVDFAQKYARLLVDYLVGDKFQAGIVLVGVGSVVGLFTEAILSKHQVGGIGVGQRPGSGSYVCKTCQKSQYLQDHQALERCHGLCPRSVFRKAS